MPDKKRKRSGRNSGSKKKKQTKQCSPKSDNTQHTLEDLWSQENSKVVYNELYEREEETKENMSSAAANQDINDKVEEGLGNITSRITQIEKELKAEIDELKESLKFSDEKFNKISEEHEVVMKENVTLKQQVTMLEHQTSHMSKKLVQLEDYSRRSNIRISGVPEEENEKCEDKITNLFGQMGCTNIDLERCHRVGKKEDGKKREIIARFGYPPDKPNVMKNRKYLPNDVYINDDYSQETTRRRNTLRPVFKVAKEIDKNTKLSGDKIIFKNKAYTLENIHAIPFDLEPIAIKEDEESVAFASRYHPFSNLYPKEVEVEGKTFASTEHYYQFKKSMEAGREDVAALVLLANEPEMAMTIGGRIKPDQNWYNTRGKAMMKKGVKRKFQDPALKKKLINTKKKKIVEGTRNTTWGIGISFTDVNVLNKGKWTGGNMMGQILCEIRDEMLAEMGEGQETDMEK